MTKMEIKLLSDNATMPTGAYEESAGYDIYAAETKVLKPQDKAKIATDIAVSIPKGYVGLLTSRSGVSSKTHLVVETGKIDSDFRGHMTINIKNDEQRLDYDSLLNNERLDRNYSDPLVYDINNEKIKNGNPFEIGNGRNYQINKGDKLAQLIVVPILTGKLTPVEEFSSETTRGEKGHGSTGI